MSGIVRGFVKRHRFQQDHKFAVLPDPPVDCADIPVAVVPLDDTTLKTLAGEIWRHLDVFGVRLSDVDKGVRAALGLEGGA